MTSGTQISVVVSGTGSAGRRRTPPPRSWPSCKKQPDLINVKSDLATQTPEIQVLVDPNKALFAGLTTAQIQGEIHNALVGTKAGTVNLASGPADVYLKLDVAGLNSVEALGMLPGGRDQGPARPAWRRSDQVQTPGPHHPRRPVARGDDHGRHHEQGHRRRLGRSCRRSSTS